MNYKRIARHFLMGVLTLVSLVAILVTIGAFVHVVAVAITGDIIAIGTIALLLVTLGGFISYHFEEQEARYGRKWGDR